MKKVLLIFGILGFLISCNKEAEKKKEEVKPVEVKKAVKKIEEIKKSKEPSLVFTVQVGAYKKANNNLSNVSNVQISQESNLYKYRLGTFLNYKDARKFRKKSLSTYPDAFVQAILNGKPISIKKALE